MTMCPVWPVGQAGSGGNLCTDCASSESSPVKWDTFLLRVHMRLEYMERADSWKGLMHVECTEQ